MEVSTEEVKTFRGQSDGLGEDSSILPISQSLGELWAFTKFKLLELQFSHRIETFMTSLARRVPRPTKSSGGGGQTN